LPLSAKTKTALEAMSNRLADYLEANPDADLADVAYTLQTGRIVHGQRRIVVCADRAQAIAALRKSSPPPDRGAGDHGNPPVVFMFPGQGSQFPGMARELYQTEPVFARHFDECAEALAPVLGRDLRDLIFRFTDEEEAANALRQTEVAQPAIFSIEYALAKLWMSWGLVPDAFVGHSVGEFAAATLAGVFTLEDALRVVTVRGRLMQELPTGSMLSVRAPVSRIESLLGERVSLAAANAPELSVVSGPADAIEALQARLDAEEIPHRFLHTSHAFHSAMMDPAVAPTVAEVEKGELSAPSIPMLSTVTGRWLSDEEAVDPTYWGRNLRQPVRFADAIDALREDESRLFLEVGPGQVLSTLAKQTVGKTPSPISFASLAHASQKGADLATLVTTAGRLWLAGAQLDWSAFHGGDGRKTALPTYPFERKRHWVEPGDFTSASTEAPAPATTPAAPGQPAAPHPGSQPASSPARGGAHEIIQQQMNVIAQQLAILRGRS
jgi:acyl transferase domain-containing protein